MTTDAPDDSFHVFDTTLRDGAQREGINLTVADKLTIARHLDEFGVGFIEGGWPGANPRDTEFFARARRRSTSGTPSSSPSARPARQASRAADDPQVKALLDVGRTGGHAGRQVARPACRAGAAHHARREPGDGPRHRLVPARAGPPRLRRLRALLRRLPRQRPCTPSRSSAPPTRRAPTSSCSATPTAACCPHRSRPSSRTVLADTGARLGIHAQDDTGCAVANTLAAVDAGATHVQCTANGYGERVGNANLFPVVAALELKYGKQVLPEGALAEMTRISHAIAEVVNLTPSTHQPYVGVSAFAHKAGLHASAIKVDPDLYQHIDPELVGNTMRMLVSDMAGRASVELKGKELGYRPRAATASWSAGSWSGSRSSELKGYTYEAADASFELLLRDEVAGPQPAATSGWSPGGRSSRTARTATTPTRPRSSCGPRVSASSPPAEGNGPVNALDRALRVAAWSGSIRSWPRWSWSTTRSASWRAGTAPTPRPGCWSPRATAPGVVDGGCRGQRHRRFLAGAGRRLYVRAAARRSGASRIARVPARSHAMASGAIAALSGAARPPTTKRSTPLHAARAAPPRCMSPNRQERARSSRCPGTGPYGRRCRPTTVSRCLSRPSPFVCGSLRERPRRRRRARCCCAESAPRLVGFHNSGHTSSLLGAPPVSHRSGLWKPNSPAPAAWEISLPDNCARALFCPARP